MCAPHQPIAEPSIWVTRFMPLLHRSSRVLDLACGNGRHTRLALKAGHRVVAVDRDLGGVLDLAENDRLMLMQADLERGGGFWPLGERTFDGVVVTNYLWRALFPHILAAVAPGGYLIYETFAEGNERFGKPSNPDFLLRKDELLEVVGGDKLQIIAYEHAEVSDPQPAVVQRICAMRQAATTVSGSAEDAEDA